MALTDIPVIAAHDTLTGNALAVLGEIETLLDSLLRLGEGGMVDIAGLPLSGADRAWLREQLGEGEVDIQLDIGGRSHIRETGLPGVWWIEHRDEQDRAVGEYLQVAYVPELISAHPDDVESGLEYLRGQLAEPS